MRFLTLMLLAAALVAGGCASKQATTDTAPAEPAQTLTGDTAVLTVFGLSCPLCANNVDKQLMRVEGVTGVKADLKSGLVVVHLDPSNPPTRDDLANAIEESGFTLVKIDAAH